MNTLINTHVKKYISTTMNRLVNCAIDYSMKTAVKTSLSFIMTGLLIANITAAYGQPQSSTSAKKVLFIGNSFTYGHGSATRYYRAASVTDLNGDGVGGVPALFKSFADQAGINYDVFVETRGGSALDFHLDNKLAVIGKHAWDQVAMHGFSTLDSKNPGNPALLIKTSGDMAKFLKTLNQNVEVYLSSTWSRADLIYQPGRHWSGTPIEQMANDVRAGHNQAAAASTDITGVNGVGEAWILAMRLGLADSNPYDGIEFGKISLWSWDYYHASDYGYYLHALVVFGNLTGIDPRTLGAGECSAFELGMAPYAAKTLQQAAFEQLQSEGRFADKDVTLSLNKQSSACIPVT